MNETSVNVNFKQVVIIEWNLKQNLVRPCLVKAVLISDTLTIVEDSFCDNEIRRH